MSEDQRIAILKQALMHYFTDLPEYHNLTRANGVYNKLHMFVAIGVFYSFEGLTSLAKICRAFSTRWLAWYAVVTLC